MTKVAAILGPTAVGKTAVAVEASEQLDAEIISIDSMQIYRGMDIGTAKPTSEQRARVPHHLLDLHRPSHELTVAEYQELGRRTIEEVARRDKLPLLVGGSGLYWRAVVDDLHFPPRSQAVRAALEAEAESAGPAQLYARLLDLDPEAAANIAPTNARRVVRALEVIEVTGRPFSEFAKSWNTFESRYDLRAAGLSRSRQDLFERIAERVDVMLAAGLVEEARALGATGLSRTARQALGYRQILEASSEITVDEIRTEIIRTTKRFARRQESWFRADPRIEWVDASSGDLVEQLIAILSK
jgi:tRNA dimethylallyltransferase